MRPSASIRRSTRATSRQSSAQNVARAILAAYIVAHRREQPLTRQVRRAPQLSARLVEVCLHDPQVVSEPAELRSLDGVVHG